MLRKPISGQGHTPFPLFGISARESGAVLCFLFMPSYLFKIIRQNIPKVRVGWTAHAPLVLCALRALCRLLRPQLLFLPLRCATGTGTGIRRSLCLEGCHHQQPYLHTSSHFSSCHYNATSGRSTPSVVTRLPSGLPTPP